MSNDNKNRRRRSGGSGSDQGAPRNDRTGQDRAGHDRSGSRSGTNRNQRSRPAPKPSAADFWGGAGLEPDLAPDNDGARPGDGARAGDEGTPPVPRINPTPDPGALPRSLGDPPIGTNAQVAQLQLAAVYEEAVKAATALAAANGLLTLDD